MLGAALKRYYNDAKVIPPAATLSNGDFTASLLYRFNIDESDIVVICKIMSLSDIALVLISVDRCTINKKTAYYAAVMLQCS